MQLEVNKLLHDIVESIDIVESHLTDVSSLSDYKADLKTIDAVERRLAIIGEALWKADKESSNILISDKRKIIALRHILVHDYDRIEDETIWIICRKHLPVLKNEILVLLTQSKP